VKVFEDFTAFDLISGGRAEIAAGRGAYTESFPLFGYDLADYGQLFEEKVELFAELLKQQPVTWSGQLRPALKDQRVFPPTQSGSLTTWIGVGGSPESVVRAARYGMPLLLAIIGGQPLRFAPYVDLFKRALTQFGRTELPVGAHSPGHVAASDQQAREELWPHYSVMQHRIGAERGWPPMTREQFEQEADDGALFVGSPQTVAAKIVATVRGLGLSRFDLKYSNGTMPHEQLLESIRLYGSEVMPQVRAQLAAS
jgi:alkanesulfonate monooxygenase SsuD/methylene tetrahydromethanopterin reductase-like flavin-dependent oxidoreductase (luciferase family)